MAETMTAHLFNLQALVGPPHPDQGWMGLWVYGLSHIARC
jgi:hypothetical protein